MSTEKLQQLAGMVQGWIKEGEMKGASYVIMRNGRLVAREVFGNASDNQPASPVTGDTIFGILSLSKIVFGTAVMVVIDRGQLSTQDTVGGVLPDFAGTNKADITMEQLLTLSSGMGLLPDLQQIGILVPKRASEEEWRQVVRDAPLGFQPGTGVEYSPSFNSNLLKWMLEKKTGMEIEAFCQKYIFQPLGMKDTTYRPSREVWLRIATLYSSSPAQAQLANSEYARTQLTAVWGSLFTTPADLAKLLQAYLNGGELNKYRLLSPEMVALGTRSHTDSLPLRTGAPGDMGYHFRVKGTRVLVDNFGDLTSPGTFGFGGANATWAWVDPDKGLVVVFLSNTVATGTQRVERLRAFNDGVVKAIVSE